MRRKYCQRSDHAWTQSKYPPSPLKKNNTRCSPKRYFVINKTYHVSSYTLKAKWYIIILIILWIFVHWSGYYSTGDIPKTRKVYFIESFDFKWFAFCPDLWRWPTTQTSEGVHPQCLSVSKLARQHWERSSVHSPWTMCCSRKTSGYDSVIGAENIGGL